MLGAPTCALMDEIVTIRPHLAAIMSGMASWMQWNMPVRLTSSMRCHSATVISTKGLYSEMPALAISSSIGPNAWRVSATAAPT